MNISPAALKLIALDGTPLARRADETAAPGSADFVQLLQHSLEEANANHVEADAKIRTFVEGGDVPIHEVMMSITKAETSIRLVTAVTSRVIAAYEEIARMQI